ncbi:hypothetical protein HF313_12850 [Massilia atriviolacea]|uniref:HAD family hydrolase n=1 Tax=Massilia atriviolacea TaxID=2495579 RepID=A0A430HQ39_9BURK|nr:hypothetical protein [Massilia atriviolacea]RSZ59635.1 hypothetical protein EJB06_05400 [Massilia atriviolacea]
MRASIRRAQRGIFGWDASAASLFGFPVCWVNRDGGPLEELGATPAIIVPDLAAMADWLLELR